MIPIPPGPRLQTIGNATLEAFTDPPGGDAADNQIRRDIPRHDRASRDDGAVADRDTRQDRSAMSEPGVVPDHDLVGAPPVEEALVILGVVPVIARAIGEVVQRGPLDGMVRGIDATGG